MPSTTPKCKALPKLSPKLAQMLRDATPQQIEEATRVAAKLLALRAKKEATRKG